MKLKVSCRIYKGRPNYGLNMCIAFVLLIQCVSFALNFVGMRSKFEIEQKVNMSVRLNSIPNLAFEVLK